MNALIAFLDKVVLAIISFALGMGVMYFLFLDALQDYAQSH